MFLAYILLLTNKQKTSVGGDFNENIQDKKLKEKLNIIQKLLKLHLVECYLSEDSAASVFSKNGTLLIHITGEKNNLRNFWSGRISSTWEVIVNSNTVGKEEVENKEEVIKFVSLKGDIKIHAHYFEDGNVQLQSSKTFPITAIEYSNEKELGEKIIVHIKVGFLVYNFALYDYQ